ncbi:hypothetical protein Csa_015560 [Cucumis sativus]|uniref:F-box domain-containing protein n=2 Tax=Cucumis sativus TaxID=3659 RepID=A0A0A0K4Y2_CUCSA|nr:hypothetical protein Csa_015560 [Cucumis sativus]
MSSLIEGLPHDVALRCLAFVPFYLHATLEQVCHSWRDAICSGEIYKVRSECGTAEDLLFVCCHDEENKWQFYDPIENFWVTLPELPGGRKHYFGVVSTHQKLFILGGLLINAIDPSIDEDFSCNEVWSFNPMTRKWSIQAPMHEARSLFACGILDGMIIVVGGMNKKFESTPKAEMYDPVKDVWIQLPDLPRICDSGICMGVVVGRKMHFIYKGLPIVQTFDTVEWRWTIEDYNWFSHIWLMTADRDRIYIMSQGYIFLQIGQDSKVVISADQFNLNDGMGMICFRGELYVIGGTLYTDRDYEYLSDVHVLTLSSDFRTCWITIAPMSRGYGSVLGCAALRV